MSKISTIIILFAYCALFFWFGISQLINPGAWTSFLPEFVGYFPIPGEMLVRFNGWAEVVAAAMLLLGCYTRLVAGFSMSVQSGTSASWRPKSAAACPATRRRRRTRWTAPAVSS